jgi:hypothetical protein
MSRRTISNSDDLIDSRDVIERINELSETRDELLYQIDAAEDKEEAEAAKIALEDWEESDEGLELKVLLKLQEEAEGGDWEYGETLIRDSYFEQYAQDFAEDIGAIDPNANWPLNHIDWGAAAEELKQDYNCVDFDGEDYWIRSC